MKIQHMFKLLGAVAVLLTLTACPIQEGGHGGGDLLPFEPEALLEDVEMVERPSNATLAAYYCPILGGDYIPFAVDGICAGFFGEAPRRSDLRFGFETHFSVSNQNTFPIPMVEMLLALDIFPETGRSELATVCVSLCDPEAVECVPPELACKDPDRDASLMRDYVPTIEDLIELAIRTATGEDLLENLQFRMIPAGETIDVRVRFELGLDAVLNIFEQLAFDSVSELVVGNMPNFDIPYSAGGALFFDVPVMGRFALDFGPYEGVFTDLGD